MNGGREGFNGYPNGLVLKIIAGCFSARERERERDGERDRERDRERERLDGSVLRRETGWFRAKERDWMVQR